jgi:carboxylesterase type B
MGERDRFTPVIDDHTLPDQVGLLFAKGSQQKVPYITGGNSWEASLGRMIGGGFSPAIAAKLVPDADKARLYPGLGGERLDAETSLACVTERDRFVSTLMTSYWVRFARTGSPNGPGLPDWPAWEPASARVLDIGDEVLVPSIMRAPRAISGAPANQPESPCRLWRSNASQANRCSGFASDGLAQ